MSHKVCFLTPGCFDKGGISRYSRYEIRALREALGAENVGVLSVLGPDDRSFEEPMPVHFAAGGVSPRTKVRYVWEAAAWTLRHRPTVVYAAHVNLAGLARGLARLVGARTVVNVYGLEVWSGMRWDARYGLRSSDLVLSDCRFTARYLEDHGLRAGETRILWDCVDVRRFTPGPPSPEVVRRYGIPDPTTGINLLTLGRLSPDAAHKGYDRLLESFARIAAECSALRLIYAGGGALIEQLRRRAGELSLSDRVHFTSFVHEADLPDVLRAGHLFSLVSDRGTSRGEGLPLTPLEAAACGAPILVGNQDGSSEAIDGDRNGFALDPFDLDAHAARIRLLSSNPALREEMGRAARTRVEQEHAYEVFRDRLLEYLRPLRG